MLPKILIVSRLVWDDKSNSNTLSNLFSNYDPERIARIYIETKQPNTSCCHRFFQISEISLIRKIFHWRYQTGREINTSSGKNNLENQSDRTTDQKMSLQEAKTMSFVRGHRSWFFSILREFLWYLNGWKSKELRAFIRDFNPDVVWLDGSPLILMNRLNNYVLKYAGCPAVTFLMDDVFNYQSCPTVKDKLFKFFLRKHVRKTVKQCRHVFVASPKMKTEYDRIFNIDSTFITKSFNADALTNNCLESHNPVRLVYLGNVLIGRLQTLSLIAQQIKEINRDEVRITLDIYTGDYIDEQSKVALNVSGVTVHGLVPYDQVPSIISNSDVQVFVEALEGRNKEIARLSFSTKIIDYIMSGKCILAVGASSLAPIEYFRNEDIALVASDRSEIKDCLLKLMDCRLISEYADKAISCGRRNHDKKMMDEKIFSILKDTANGNLQ